MGRVKVAGLGLATAAALILAAGSTQAWAAPPEFGRCVKTTGGVYANSGCTKIEAGINRFEWVPGPGSKPNFTTAIKPETKATLEIVGGSKVVCLGEASTGRYTGPKTLLTTIAFNGCGLNGGKCTTSGQAEGTIVTALLQGELGIVKKGTSSLTDQIGLDLSTPGNEANWMEFSCGGVPVVVTKESSLIKLVKTNKMLGGATEKFVETKGHQTPERFEGGEPDVLLTSVAGAPAGRTGLLLTWILKNEEKLEVNSVV
jgi:hypothetical protein